MRSQLALSRAAQIGLTTLLAAGTALAGCGPNAASETPAAASPSPLAPTASLPAIDEASIEEWTRFRRAYGLRSDRAWVLRVARDANVVNELSVPLLPSEIDLVSSRNLNVQELAAEVRTYGTRFPDDYGGVFIEAARVVVQFNDRIEEHSASLKAFFGPTAPVDMRAVQFSLRDLDDMARKVEADREWFATVDAELYGASAREQTNSVRVRYIAVDESVEPAILEHFGNPEWMSLSWYGPPPWPGPWGSLLVQVIDRAGRPVDATCSVISKDRAVPGNYLPLTGTDGVCSYERIEAVEWDVEVAYDNLQGQHTAVTESTRVRADAQTVLQVVVNQ